MVKVELKNCPKVVLDGVAYKDVTELLYEDTKYRKTYPTKDELAKIRAHEIRKYEARIHAAIRSRELEAAKLEEEESEKVRAEEERRKAIMLAEEERIRKESEDYRRKKKEKANAVKKQEQEETSKRKNEKIKREKEIERVVLKALNSGVKRNELGEKYGFTRTDIVKAINGLHKSRKLEKKVKKKYTKEEDEILVTMRKRGEVFANIGKVLERSTASVVNRWRYLENKGVV